MVFVSRLFQGPKSPEMTRRKPPIAAGLALVATLVAGLGGVPNVLAAPAPAESLVILHTNDIHSHLMPFHRADTLRVGGAAARADLIRRERERTPDLLLLDAGD